MPYVVMVTFSVRCQLLLVLSARVAIRTDADAWIFIDVPALICSQVTEINISIPDDLLQKNKSYVPTFYQTSPEPVNITFVLVDAAGEELITNSSGGRWTLQLPDPRSVPNVAQDDQRRRLKESVEFTGMQYVGNGTSFSLAAAVEDEGDYNCETFFLLDGRSTVDVSDTWGDARNAFQETCTNNGFTTGACTDAEESLFHGYPKDTGRLQEMAADCARLMDHAAAVSEVTLNPWDEATTHLPSRVPLKPTNDTDFFRYAAPRRAKGAGGLSMGTASFWLSARFDVWTVPARIR